MDLYDYKPKMGEFYDKDLPDSVRMGQRLNHHDQRPGPLPDRPSKYRFKRMGQCGMWMNDELLPFTSAWPTDMCSSAACTPRRSTTSGHHVHADAATSHRPAVPRAWASYGLGSLNENLPTSPSWCAKPTNQSRCRRSPPGCGSPATCRASTPRCSVPAGRRPDPLHQQPPGVTPDVRRTPSTARKLTSSTTPRSATPETITRIKQYEMAFRMQASVPELADLSKEDAKTFELYGPEAKKPARSPTRC